MREILNGICVYDIERTENSSVKFCHSIRKPIWNTFGIRYKEASAMKKARR